MSLFEQKSTRHRRWIDDIVPFDPPMGELEKEFWYFHHDNPQIYQYICRFTNQAIKRGYTRRFSIGMVCERIRWETWVETTDEKFKLSNNHRAYYARLWMREHPSYPDFFQTKELRSKQRERPADRYGRLL